MLTLNISLGYLRDKTFLSFHSEVREASLLYVRDLTILK